MTCLILETVNLHFACKTFSGGAYRCRTVRGKCDLQLVEHGMAARSHSLGLGQIVPFSYENYESFFSFLFFSEAVLSTCIRKPLVYTSSSNAL